MGFRFRKSLKIAPGLKLNLNKKSVGITAGTKGAHFTLNSKGKKTSSVGIPGTGISFTNIWDGGSGKSKQHTKSNNVLRSSNDNHDDQKKWYQKTGWIIILLIYFFPVGLFLMWKHTRWNKWVKVGISTFFAICLLLTLSPSKLQSIVLNTDSSRSYDINEEILIDYTIEPSDSFLTESDFILSGGKIKESDEGFLFYAEDPGEYKIYAESYGIKSNELNIKIEDKKAIEQAEREAKRQAEEEAKRQAEEEAKRQAEEEAKRQAEEAAKRQAEEEARRQAEEEARRQAQMATQQNSASAAESADPIVYITNTGGKYHRATCRHLKSSRIEKRLSEVINGYGPCGVCNPPTQ